MRTLGLTLVLGSLALLAACGGGSSSSGSSSIIGVTASCSPSTIQSSQTSQCTATVTGTGNFSTAVNWAASAGTINSSGLFTAPSGVVTSMLVSITATSTQDSTKVGNTTVVVNPAGQANNNVEPLVVDAGPQPSSFFSVNEAFATVTVCVPGTTTCQSIDHVLVDTGSSGLRLLAGLLSISLPQETDGSGNALHECQVFLDGYTWGNVNTADITMAGEKAASAPIQIIQPSSSSPPVPSSCSGQTTGPNEGDSVSALGANGILGVGLFQQDCGLACVINNPPPTVYYTCPSSGCAPVNLAQNLQVTNPVFLFTTDNNGVLIQLPSVPNGGSANVNGSLIFGIGTQSNNGLGSATVLTVPTSGNNIGDITTLYNGQSYPSSFIDSGSNGMFFLDSSSSGLALCGGNNNSWYCPGSATNFTATNQGANNATAPANFTIENALTLFNNNGGADTAFSTLGGPSSGSNFDFGLSFFFGRNVFTAIEGTNTPGGTGPYVAY